MNPLVLVKTKGFFSEFKWTSQKEKLSNFSSYSLSEIEVGASMFFKETNQKS